MPIYEYACDACGNRFEKLIRRKGMVPSCPSCGAENARKLVSASGFILKGSGWYKDHYGLKKSGSGDSGSTSTGTSDSGGSGGSDGAGSSSTSTSSSSSDGGSSSGSSTTSKAAS